MKMGKLGLFFILALVIAVFGWGCGGGSGGGGGGDTPAAAVWGQFNWGEARWQ